jgi:aarF domain-containing kinase
MLLKDNFMHADLHPGNILYHEIETTTPLLEMQMVDAGMTAELTALQQLNFIGLIEAIGEGNGAAAADHVITFSPSNKLDDHRRDEFRADMINLFKSVARGYGNGVDLGIVLRGVLELVRRHKVTIEANYATLVLNALCLDGMAQSILPTYNILDGAKLLLKLHKHTKRLPVTVGRFVRKLAWPVVQKLKTWSDRKFLKELKSKTPEELKEIFEMSKKFVI